MRTKAMHGRCPLCGGTKRAGTTTFTVDLGFGIVVVRDVPATVCGQCGADWIEDTISSRQEDIRFCLKMPSVGSQGLPLLIRNRNAILVYQEVC
jgi:YgiT-type zinc finger domain-containing protein